MTKDIVIFTNGNLFAYIILKPLIEYYHQRIAGVVLVSGDYKGNSGLNALVKYFNAVTFPFFVYKIFTLILVKILRIIKPKQCWDVESFCNNYDIKTIISVPNIKSEDLYVKIKNLNATYLISVSCPQFISKKWLELFQYKAINIHSSDLPSYAGLAPYYWVLANNETKTATSVHYITPKFDAGNILMKGEISIEKNISVFKLFLELSVLGGSVLHGAFKKLEEGDEGTKQDLTKYSYYSNPDFKSYLSLIKNHYYLISLNDIKYIIKSLKL